jgi:integrase
MKRGVQYPAEPLTFAEVQALLASTSPTSISGIRARAIVFVLWRTAVRVFELVALRPCDLDLQAGTLRILRGRMGGARTVPVDDECAEALRAWLSRRPVEASRLFCSLEGEALSTASVRELLKRLRSKAGVVKRVTPHGFRATWATVAARQLPLTDLQAILGHEDVATTARYIKRLGGPPIDAARRIKWN